MQGGRCWRLDEVNGGPKGGESAGVREGGGEGGWKGGGEQAGSDVNVGGYEEQAKSAVMRLCRVKELSVGREE